MATKKTVSINKDEESNVNIDLNKIKLDAVNEVADNIIDCMNLFFSLNKINITDFNLAMYERSNHSDPVQAKDLLSYMLRSIPYFNRRYIGLNTNSKGIITSIYIMDEEVTASVSSEYII